MRALPAIVTTAAFTLAMTACGGDDDSTTDSATDSSLEADVGTGTDTSVDPDVGEPEDEQEDGQEDPGEQPDEAPGDGGSGSAVLTLFTGEQFEFSVLCTLEPQVAAGSEILFTATSYDFPGLDITQFGDEGAVTGIGSVEVWDEDYETLWSASTLHESVGGSLELSVDGSTITGTGDFYPAADLTVDPVPGTVTANC